jgi:hypothetical protein
MPYGKDQAARRAAARRHATRVRTCKCGREVRGNAYYRHRAACPAYLAWRKAQGL